MASLFFKLLFPFSRIRCFEPDPCTFLLLEKNVSANHLADMTRHNVVLRDEDSCIPFYTDPATPGSLLMSTKSDRQSRQAVSVPARRLSAYIREEVDLLKLDIEGAETRVLQELSTRKTLPCVKRLIIEYHHRIAGDRSQMSSLLSLLEQNRFE
jgi:FkbM family methyltransferase